MKMLKRGFRIMSGFIFILNFLFAAANWTHQLVGYAPTSTRPVVCSDPQGNIHVAWTSDDPYGELVQYATNQYGGWGYQKKVAGSSNYQAYTPSITTDREGHAYIVFRYYSYAYTIRYVTNRNLSSGYWDNESPMSSGHYHESSIEVDQDYNTHIFAQEDTWGSNVFYQQLDLNNVVIPGGTSQFFATAIDQNDVLHFVGSHSNNIWYTYYSNGSWSDTLAIDQISTAAYHPAITVDNQNNLHVVFASNAGFYYSNNVSGDWGTPGLFSTSCIFPDVVTDDNGKAHVAWYTQVEYGGLYYTNNVNGDWLTAEYITTINEDYSSATEDAAHVEGKIALDPHSNKVSIVYVGDDGKSIYLAQTSDFNLRSTYSTDTTTMLNAAAALNEPTEISTHAGDKTALFDFTISDQSGDGLATKTREMIIRRGPAMSEKIGFTDLFNEVMLYSSQGDSFRAEIYYSRLVFGTPTTALYDIQEGQGVTFTLKGTLKHSLANVDGKRIEFKINGLYDIIIDTTGSRFAYSNSDVTSGEILIQVAHDHFEFANLIGNFFNQNLCSGFSGMELRLVDKYGTVADSVSGVSVTLSAVELDGETAAPYDLASTEGLTKNLTNGKVQWGNLTYPQEGPIRILATSDLLTDASDTLIILPYYKRLVISENEAYSQSMDALGWNHDYYQMDYTNNQFPDSAQLANYNTVFLIPSSSFAYYVDTTAMKKFLISGEANDVKKLAALGEYALGNHTNSAFAETYLGGYQTGYFSHQNTTFYGVAGTEIGDGLQIDAYAGWTNVLTANDNAQGSTIFLEHQDPLQTLGILNQTGTYKTVLMTLSFDLFSNVSQQDTLFNRILQWFEREQSNTAPVWTNLPDTSVYEDSTLVIPFDNWYPYVDDPDTPAENLSWNVSNGSLIDVSVTADSVSLVPRSDLFGKDTLLVSVSDGNSADTTTLIVTVISVNDAPILHPVGTLSTREDSTAEFTLTAEDIENDRLGYAILNQPVHGIIRSDVDTLVSFDIMNLEAGPADGNWMFDSDFTPFSEDGDQNSNYAYTGFQWNADGHGDGSCLNNNPGSGAISSSSISKENLAILDDTAGVRVFLDDLELAAFQHINVIDPHNAWDILGEAGDRRLYHQGIGEIRINGNTKLRVTNIVLRLTNYYPDPIGPGGADGYGLGIGFGAIDTSHSDPDWVTEFDPNHTGLVEFNFQSLSPTIQECYGAYDVVQISLKPVSHNSFIYEPQLNYFGTDYFTGIVFDGQSYSNVVMGEITVNPVAENQIPDIVVNEDAGDTAVADLATIFTDLGDQLTYNYTNSDTNLMQISITNDWLNLSFSPDSNGIATITIRADNNSGQTESDTALVTILPVNDAPYFTAMMPDTLSFSAEREDTLRLKGLVGDIDSPDSGLVWSAVYSNFVSTTFYDSILVLWTADEQAGTDTLILSISDQEYTVTDSMLINVIPITGGDFLSGTIPGQYQLHQNYPNPFNPMTTIRFGLPEQALVSITIYDLLGHKIRTYDKKIYQPGYHKITWDATQDNGNPVASGVYFLSLSTPLFQKTIKMVFLR